MLNNPGDESFGGEEELKFANEIIGKLMILFVVPSNSA